MTSKAHVETDFIGDGIQLMVATKIQDGRLVRVWETNGESVFVRSGEAAVSVGPQGHMPFLRLSDEEGRAIYQALGEYFGTQVSDNRLLRQDYEAERARVDKFINSLVKSLPDNGLQE